MVSNDSDKRAKLSKEDQEKLDALRQALIEGEQSGEPTPFDFDEFLKEVHERFGGKNKK
jgi:antitoxin ParD1/3/4